MSRQFQVGDYKYEHLEEWCAFPDIGVVSDIACDSQDRVYACVRLKQGPDGNEGEIWVFDRDGSHIKSWGKSELEVPHGIWISSDNDIFLTDSGDHTVTKFDMCGSVLMTLGTKSKQGAEGMPFRSPTRAVLSASNEIFVSDGYQQNRCHRFTADGELILSWGTGDPVYYEQTHLGKVNGTPGTGPCEFNLPHDITIDRNDHAYVLDRGNNRLQVFDNEGGFLDEWSDVPSGNDSVIDENDLIHIATGHSGIQIRTLSGDLIGIWGENGELAGQFRGFPHGIWIDSRGDVYVAQVGAQLALDKFARL